MSLICSCLVSNENQVKKSVMEPNTSVNNRTQVFSGVSGKCCECSAKNSQEQRRGPDDKKEKERKFKIDFENYLHNKVYVKTRSGRLSNYCSISIPFNYANFFFFLYH